MLKSIRSFVLVATVSLTAVPALHADRMGTNPRPAPPTGQAISNAQIFAYTVLSYLGL